MFDLENVLKISVLLVLNPAQDGEVRVPPVQLGSDGNNLFEDSNPWLSLCQRVQVVRPRFDK